MKLYILTGQVGFLCRCHGQATASIQAAIDIIKQTLPSVSMQGICLKKGHRYKRILEIF